MSCQTKVSSGSVSYKKIIETIVEHFEDPEDAKPLINKINSKKKQVTSTKLRIGKPSKKNNSQALNKIINNKSNNDNQDNNTNNSGGTKSK